MLSLCFTRDVQSGCLQVFSLSKSQGRFFNRQSEFNYPVHYFPLLKAVKLALLSLEHTLFHHYLNPFTFYLFLNSDF